MLQPNKKSRVKRFIIFLVFAALASLLFGVIIMFLWNSVLPDALFTGRITYWQAVALFILCRLLFGRLRPPYRGSKPFYGPSNRWREKWSNMSEDERTKFKDEWKKRCEQRKR